MKNITTLLLLFAVLLFSQCTKSEQITTQFEGKYMGTLTGEWEQTIIKNFKTNPDTVYSSKQYKYENLIFTIKNLDFKMTSSTLGGIGTFSIKGDSIFFVDLTPCPYNADCASYISGNWQYEISKSGLKLTRTNDGRWWQRNTIDRQFDKDKTVYELHRIN